MSNRTIKGANNTILFVPLNRLKKSPKNVRKMPHTKTDIQAFAASIAALGMLQYPVVEPEVGPRGMSFGMQKGPPYGVIGIQSGPQV